MAGGHAAAAHRDGEVRRQSVEQRAELLGQLPRRLETAVGEVVGERTVHRARHVARDPVEPFLLAAETRRRARVDQQFAHPQRGLDLVRVEDAARVEPGVVLRGDRHRHAVVHRQAERGPALPAAVQHRDLLVPQRAQQEPRARRERAAVGVVGHDLGLRRNAPAAEAFAELRGVGPRMAALRGLRRTGQVAIELRVTRAGNVRLHPRALAGPGVGQVETAIEHDHVRAPEPDRKRFRLHECGPAGHQPCSNRMCSSRCARLWRISAVAPQMRRPPAPGPTYSYTRRGRPPT